jgi:uncharacterized protein involved in exopolysaccharide biosynthesis
LTTPRARSTEPLSVATPVEPLRPDSAMRPDPEPPHDEELSIVSLVNTILRHRWLIVLVTLAGGAYTGFKSAQIPRVFTSESQFMPKGARGQSQLQGLAAQFGIAGGGDPTQSSQFYVDLLRSRAVLAGMRDRQFHVRTDSGMITGNLAKVYHMRAADSVSMTAAITNAVRSRARSVVSARTGVITLRVSDKYPDMAVQLNQALLDQVNIFNLGQRQAQAGAEREFIEKRLADAQTQLSQAEANLQSFLMENRDFRSSPNLSLEFDRLNRAVNSRQSLYNALASSYEQAKIEEVRDLPVITVLEPPDYPIQPDPRRTRRKTMLGLLVGFVLGIGLAFARDRVAANRRVRSDEFAEFAALKREALGDLTHPWRPFTRIRVRRDRS